MGFLKHTKKVKLSKLTKETKRWMQLARKDLLIVIFIITAF